MFQRILVPVDLSDIETANRTLAVASELAEASGGHLRMVYVQYMPEMAMGHVPASVSEADEKAAIGKLKDLAAKANLPEDRVSVVSPAGRVYTEVLAAADDFKADLIVVGPQPVDGQIPARRRRRTNCPTCSDIGFGRAVDRQE